MSTEIQKLRPEEPLRMRKSREEAAKTRQRIVSAAAESSAEWYRRDRALRPDGVPPV